MTVRLFTVLGRALSIVQDGLDNEGLAWLASEPWAKAAALRRRGPAPRIQRARPGTIRPLVIVTVRQDGLCETNLLASPDIHHPSVHLRIVDDPSGLRTGSLSRALAEGLGRRDLPTGSEAAVAFVSQDSFLPEGWLAALETSLRALDAHDPDWGVAGVSGIDERGRRVGRVSEPWGVIDTFRAEARWLPAWSLDDCVLLLHAARPLPLDAALPGFEGLGASLSQAARSAGRSCYVIDAPAIVEHVSCDGRPVTRAVASRKTRGQFYRPHRAQREVTLEYLAGPSAFRDASTLAAPLRPTCDPRAGALAAPVPAPDADVAGALDRPLVLLGRGGGGSRLVSLLAQDCGVFVGNVNVSGDCLDMVPAVYTGVLRSHDCPAAWQRERVVPALREAAAAMLSRGWPSGRPWGFKVPESLLLLPEIAEAFPRARFLLLIRDPVSTCLRRSHITAQFDNPIGRVSLSAAYRAADLAPDLALSEPVEVRSARVTLHQVGSAIEFLRTRVSGDRRLEIRFEDLVGRPAETRALAAGWLGLDVRSHRLERAVDDDRATVRSATPPDIVRQVEQLLGPLAEMLGPASASKVARRV